MTVITRFAPSPTGFLHIGGARTALFNWLYARHHGGKFLLRIEDTDRARSTDEAINAILNGMKWLGLEGDEDPVFQFANQARHTEIANQLLKTGHAYYCYTTTEELQTLRDEAQGEHFKYDGKWRDRDPDQAPEGVQPVVRFKAPQNGATEIIDLVQGIVRVENQQLDDMVLLRSDGTPTYMLSVVVDDHDMGITHIIRGDDHLTNSFRQYQIYKALGWEPPKFSHIPLIHGSDGKKLSKRHGALGVEAYKDMGILPAALKNYLLRLGWGKGDEEIIPIEKAIEWFDMGGIGKSASRFDMAKLLHLNEHYMRQLPADDLIKLIDIAPTDAQLKRLQIGVTGLADRSSTLIELADKAIIYLKEMPIKQQEGTVLNYDLLNDVAATLEETEWNKEALANSLKSFCVDKGIKFKEIGLPLRLCLTGEKNAPGIYDLLLAFGRQESLNRIKS
jgi:glutamyl-tRNA synthetase